jgi:RNA polymerase sigma-70 factor (ECF subfamily)
MDRAVSTLEAAVAGGHHGLARRALGGISNEDEREASLEVLARHAAAGSELATELLIETVDRFGVVRRVFAAEAAVDDMVQDTLITLAESIGSFRGEAKFTTWLQQLTSNISVDDSSAAARISSLVASRASVRQRLDQLPERYRDAVLLRDVERLPYAEVATRLGRNVTTIRSHVARGRALLAGLLDRDTNP